MPKSLVEESKKKERETSPFLLEKEGKVKDCLSGIFIVSLFLKNFWSGKSFFVFKKFFGVGYPFLCF
jgi:hypothetical protein